MVQRMRNRRGQSIVEYLVVAAAIIAAVLALGPTIGGQVSNIGGAAGTQMGQAAQTVADNVAAARQ